MAWFYWIELCTKASKYTFDELPFYEIGWRLMEVWGNGFATEGAEAVLEYAKQQVNEVYAVLQKIMNLHVRLWKK